MDIETAREYCLSKKAVTECFPFDEYSLVMKVMDKMFALIDLESANKICLKCGPRICTRTAGALCCHRRCLSLQQKVLEPGVP